MVYLENRRLNKLPETKREKFKKFSDEVEVKWASVTPEGSDDDWEERSRVLEQIEREKEDKSSFGKGYSSINSKEFQLRCDMSWKSSQ